MQSAHLHLFTFLSKILQSVVTDLKGLSARYQAKCYIDNLMHKPVADAPTDNKYFNNWTL